MRKQVPSIFQDRVLLKEINNAGYKIEPYAHIYKDKKLSKEELARGLDKTGFCVLYRTIEYGKKQINVLRYDCFQDFMSDSMFGYSNEASYTIWDIRRIIAIYKMEQLRKQRIV